MPTDHEVIRLRLVAPDGRMGTAISRAVGEEPGFAIDHEKPDVIVDFSAPDALATSLELARRLRKPLLIGTTGLAKGDEAAIADTAHHVAVLRAANTSLGVAVLVELVQRAARILDADWDIEILEMHHRMKRDAPSGTALLLGEAAAAGRGEAPGREIDRSGNDLARKRGAIGYASLRGGSVAGDHDVIFAGREERLILAHRAESRSIFARGALAACRFLMGKSPGLYGMSDVVADL